jgi:phosphoserine aminotransferase
VRIFNFAAGPAMLPADVLGQIRDELTDWQGSGSSVMEASHRSKAFLRLVEETESTLRELLAIPAGYKVLFLHGGATAQFSAIPMNLAGADSTVDYLVTGAWSKKALAEAARLIACVNLAADEESSGYTTVPDPAALRFTPGAAYVHYTPNETIGGVEFFYIPETRGTPLVADMSSTILSRPLEVSRFGLIYASTQKNLGIAGLAIVIVREELIGRARAGTPPIWDYHAMVKNGSMLNTPPTFAWYVAGLVLRWLKSQGGLTAIAARNRLKAQVLYAAIEASGFYKSPVALNARSWMNVPFTLSDPKLDAAFLDHAGRAGLTNLEGHRSVGGMRASLYNAMPMEGVASLVDFMREFERRHG